MSLPNATATIPMGSSTSNVVTMVGKLSGISIPAAWAAAALSFQVSPDNGATWFEFFMNGNEFVIPNPGPSAFVGIDFRFWGGVTALIVRSGTSGAPVNQTSQVVLTLTQQA